LCYRSRCNLRIKTGDDTHLDNFYNIKGLENRKLIFDIDPVYNTQISAELIIDDLLNADNYASAYISSNTKKRVLLVTPGNFFLENVLKSNNQIILETYTGMLEGDDGIQSAYSSSIYSPSGVPVHEIPDNFDLVIFDRIPPPDKEDSGRYIFIDVFPSGNRTEQEKVKPQAVSRVLEHKILDSVNFNKVSITKAWPPLAGPQIVELVSGGNTGLLYLLDSKYLKFIYLPFDLIDSDLPLRSSFPILIKNSIQWLTDNYSRSDINQYNTGDTVLIGTADPIYNESIITDPTGKKLTIEGNKFKDTKETGIYRFEYGEKSFFGSVNLLNKDESNISSRFPEITEEDREEKTGEYKFPVFSFLLILALILFFLCRNR